MTAPSDDELLTDEQMMEELYAKAHPVVAKAIRDNGGASGNLPLHAIKKDLRLVPVRAWKRIEP